MPYILDLTVNDNQMKDSVVVLIVFSIIMQVITYIANYFEIKNNWSRMRCRPEVMLNSWMYGIDTNSNMEYCLENAGKQMKHGQIVGPVVKNMDDTKNQLNRKISKANKELDFLKEKIANADLYKNKQNTNLAIAIQNNILAVKEGMQKIIASLIIQKHMNNGVLKMTSGTKTLNDSLRQSLNKIK
jgi:hypothetical protein